MRQSLLFALIPLAILGCGGGDNGFPTAEVSGQVLCEGKPVANVRVNFAPLSKKSNKGKFDTGKMGEGITEADGTFTVSTYGNGDGAVVGRHSVSVSRPHPEDFPDFKCNCMTVGNKQPIKEVEVTADGQNEFILELPPKTVDSKPDIRPDELEDARKSAEEEG